MNGQGLTMRPAEPGDYQAIARLLNGAHRIASILANETEATVKERAHEALTVVVADGREVVATLTAAPAGSYYGRLARPGQMEVSRLAVHPSQQGRGVGKAMLQTFAANCKRQGVQALVGATLDSMTAARGLYETIGAVQGTIPGAKAHGYTLHLTTEPTKDAHHL